MPPVMRYEDLEIGMERSFQRRITGEEVHAFARLSGDHNPLHLDVVFAQKTAFHKPIVHGMFLGSLFSSLIGMHCPGRNSVYMTQSLEFKMPVYYDEEIVVRGTIVEKSDALRWVTLRTEILKAGKVAVSGEARVKVLDVP